MRNDFRGTGLERTTASDAWHPLVTRTVEHDSNWRRSRTIFANVS